MKNRKAKKGFTIIELVIVIAVIGILAAVLIPTFSGVIDKANASAAAQNAKVIYEEASVAAAMGNGSLEGMYISDNAGKYIYKVVGGSLELQENPTLTSLTATSVKSNMKIYMAENLNVTKDSSNSKKITIQTGDSAITSPTSVVIRNIDGEEFKLTGNTVSASDIDMTSAESGWYSFVVKTSSKTYTGVFYLA